MLRNNKLNMYNVTNEQTNLAFLMYIISSNKEKLSISKSIDFVIDEHENPFS